MAKPKKASTRAPAPPAPDAGEAVVMLVPERGRILTIDIVRGFAIAWVVLYHLWTDIKFPRYGTVPDRFEAVPERFADCQILDGFTALSDAFLRVGFLGVPLFMMLSGLSLTIVALRRDTKISDTPRFWYARIRRVMIPYWFGFFFTVAFAAALAFVQWQRHGGEGYAHYFRKGDINMDTDQLLAGFTMIPRAFRAEWQFAPEGSLWFVLLLVQYYLLFPVLLVLLRRIGPWFFLLTTLIVTLVFVHGVLVWDNNLLEHHHVVDTVAPFRIFEFGLGMTAGWLMVKRPALMVEYATAWLDQVSIVLLGALFFVGSCMIDPTTGTSLIAFQTSGIAFGMLLILFPLIAKTPGKMETFAPARLLTWIGMISYTILIVNEPMRSITHHLRAEDASMYWQVLWIGVLYIPLTLLVARPLAVWLGLVERAAPDLPGKGTAALADIATEPIA